MGPDRTLDTSRLSRSATYPLASRMDQHVA